jgi:hypothetical protein
MGWSMGSKKGMRVIALIALLVIPGCDTGQRITHLEKENEELKAEVKRNSAVADYDLQAKCAKDSRTWFKENWSADKDTILLDYENHYTKAQNTCFVLVQYHYNFGPNGSWINDMTLWNIYENAKYGSFAESTTVHFKPSFETTKSVSTCVVHGKKCTTQEEFNSLIRPYFYD